MLFKRSLNTYSAINILDLWNNILLAVVTGFLTLCFLFSFQLQECKIKEVNYDTHFKEMGLVVLEEVLLTHYCYTIFELLIVYMHHSNTNQIREISKTLYICFYYIVQHKFHWDIFVRQHKTPFLRIIFYSENAKASHFFSMYCSPTSSKLGGRCISEEPE